MGALLQSGVLFIAYLLLAVAGIYIGKKIRQNKTNKEKQK